MLLIFIRTFKEAWVNFFRNGWLSVAAVSVMLMSLFFVSVIFIVAMTANEIMKNVQDKVNVSVYFKTDVTETDILKIKTDMENFDVVRSVDYVSKEKALEDFKKNNADEPKILQALDELGGNPLLSSLVIKANDATKYDLISEYINSSPFKSEVSRVNYGKTKEVINKLNTIIVDVRKVGLILAGLFATVSVLIIFNTIRITIYTHKQEIEIMRLVGASNMYIRLPFIFEGIIYGILASLISMLVLFLSIKFASPHITKLISSEKLIAIYLNNFWILLGVQFAVGAFLGMFSSWIAIRRYLKI